MRVEKKLKVAIVGFGFISSKGHLPAYLQRMKSHCDIEIVAICDICPERKGEVPPGVRFYTDYRELISNEAGKIDVLDVSTHAADHYKISKLGLLSGLHVLCEKPLTTTILEARDLIKTAIFCKRILFPCHNYKHAPVVKAIRDVIKSGKIGSINSITLNTFRNTHAIGTKEWLPDWRRFRKYSGGGIAMDHGSHSLYLMFEWLGGYPKSVSASSFNLQKNQFDTEDNFFAVYEFEQGLANVHLTWTAGVRKVLYALQGDKGAITVDDDRMQLSVLNAKDSDLSSHKAEWITENYSISSDWMDSSHANWFNSMFDKFKIAVLTDDFLNDEIKDAYYCVQSIMKAYESIEKNSIKLPLENNFLQI